MVKTPRGLEFRSICRRTLVAIFLVLPGIAKSAPVTIPYAENFNTGSSTFSTGTAWSHVSQKYRASVSSGGYSGSSVEAPAFPDGFHMEATLSGFTGATGDNSCGFGFLGKDATFSGGSSPYYLADVKPGGSKVRLIQVASPNTTFVDNESMSFTLAPGQPFKLAVEGTYDGPVLRIKVIVSQGANQSIHVFDEDTPLIGTYFGFRARSVSGAMSVDYDDFLLRNITTVAFTAPPTAFARGGLPYSSTVTATTTAATPITLSAVELPSWLALTDNGNGTASLSGTPPAGLTGTFTLKISADDANGPPVVQEFPLMLPGISGVVISEFVASNNGSFLDEDGDESDWVEIFNADPASADLGGWKLKDDKTAWTIPAGTIIPPFGHLIIFASDKNRTAPYLHTNFKLSSSAGSYLALARPDNSIASEYPSYPAQREGASFGMFGDYLSRGLLIPSTPGAINPATGFADFTPPPTFSVPRGVFNAPQSVTLGCTLAGSTISYTADGSEPSLTNGTLIPPADAASLPTATIVISTTSVVRAAAFRPGYVPSPSITGTYIFPDDVVTQSSNGVPPAGWPTGTVNGQILDYGMDPDVINTPAKAEELKTALRSLPTFSIVTDRKHLFDPVTGIYVNAYGREKEWERPVSMEMIKPDGTSAFQVNCGIRMRGGVSRDGHIPKHSFHFYFRSEYGAGMLKYPLFDNQGAPEFDRIDLRSTQGGSAWHSTGATNATYMRDEWSRATQGDMGHAHTRSRFVHLYINGQYWGIYATQERADNAYAASYYGGEKEDYDIIKTYTLPHRVEAADGDAVAWTQLFNAATAGFASDAAYYAVQGRNPDGSRSATIKPLVEIDNLIDYMILNMFTNNTDGPVNPGDKNVPKNFYCFRPRDGSAGFRFVAHDFEDTFSFSSTQHVTGHFATDNVTPVAGSTLVYFNPRWLHLRLVQNPNYLRRFGDRVQKNLFNGGPLSAAAGTARWAAMRAVLSPAMIAESARWGDAKVASPRLVSDWNSACNGFFNPNNTPVTGTLVSRPASFITLLRDTTKRGYALFPSIDAPVLSQNGGIVTPGAGVTLTSGASTQIFYTLDGRDPTSPDATLYSGAIPINLAVTNLKARALHTASGTWSALTEARFTFTPVPAAPGNLAISEFNYNPPPPDTDDLTEFIEIFNHSNSLVELNGAKLVTAVTFTFPSMLLEPGQRVVVIKDRTAFEALHGKAVSVAGVWSGSLNQSGEAIILQAANGTEIEQVFYGATLPWPTAASNNGRSLVRISPALPPNSPYSWRPSIQDNGNPGTDDSFPLSSWLSANGFADGNSIAPSGLKALAHFASGHPVGATHAPPLTIGRGPTLDTVSFRRRLASIDSVRCFLEQSTDLASWPVSREIDAASSGIFARVANADGTEEITIRLPAAQGTTFYRLRYTAR